MIIRIIFAFIFYANVAAAQNVNIPDPIFKAYLLKNNEINSNGDAEIQEEEAINFKGAIYCRFSFITDLSSIEAFTNLTDLDCSFNHISSLDVSKNINLKWLHCASNQLSSLDVSNNVNLNKLDCSGNQLTNLDVSNNINLIALYCNHTQVTNLDVSNNINLAALDCSHTQVTSFDISKNVHLEYLDCSHTQVTSLDISKNIHLDHLDCNNTPKLTCIKADAQNAEKLKSKDARVNTNCK